jgi:hypothetical protein
MATTATVAVRNSSVSINEDIDVTIAVTNGGVADVVVRSVRTQITPNPSVIGQPKASIMAPVTVPAGETRYFPAKAMVFAPTKPGEPMWKYTINAMIYLSDGTGVSATAASIFSSPPDADMPDIGQARLDSNLNSFYLLLLAI